MESIINSRRVNPNLRGVVLRLANFFKNELPSPEVSAYDERIALAHKLAASPVTSNHDFLNAVNLLSSEGQHLPQEVLERYYKMTSPIAESVDAQLEA